MKRQHDRPVADRIEVAAPDLQIVSSELWDAAHVRMETTRQTYLRGTDGQLWGGPANGQESKYLLTGLPRCGTCGASLIVRSRQHGTRRAFFYVCYAFHHRGRSACANSLEIRVAMADDAILSAIEGRLLDEGIIAEAIARAAARLQDASNDLPTRRSRLRRRLEQPTTELGTLTAAVLTGGGSGHADQGHA